MRMVLSSTSYAVYACVMAAILGGCGSSTQSPYFPAVGPLSVHRIVSPDVAKKGIYVSASYGTAVAGFSGTNKICQIHTGKVDINAIGVDTEGNLMIPFGKGSEVHVYRGPGLCGGEIGKVHDPYGQAANAASLNAPTGKIVVVNLVTSSKGNVVVCTLKGGCTTKLDPNPHGEPLGVAMAKNGDCWVASGSGPPLYTPYLTYWHGCTGKGKAATGLRNEYTGGLSIDKDGNLVSVSFGGSTGQLWVYSGCNPTCKVVGGPFALQGNVVLGSVNHQSDLFGGMEQPSGQVGIWEYSPKKLTFKYAFSSGFSASMHPLGFAFSPASAQ